MKLTHVAIGIVQRGGLVLVCRRRATDALAGYWEFPGGKVEAGESAEQCLHRELREELGITIKIRTELELIEHTYPHVRVSLHPFLCDHIEGEAKPLSAEALCWVKPAELTNYKFPPANDNLLTYLQRVLR